MKDAKFLGCMVGVVAIFVMLPLWGAMTAGVLIASEAPTWCWVAFWLYVPLSFVFQIAAKVIEALNE